MFDYGSYQWNNRNRANLIYWRGLVIIGNGLKNSYSSLSLRKKINSSLVSSELFLFINPSNPETQNDSSDKLRAGATFCIQAKVCLRRF